MSLPANVIAFRELLQSKFPEAHALGKPEKEVWRSGVPCLDKAELQRGTITEIVGEGISCGVGVLLAALLRRKTSVTEYTAMIDGSDAFDPWSVDEPSLERFLWIRCQQLPQAIRAADLLLRDGNIPLVLLDVQLHPAKELLRLPSSVWHRLRMLGEKSGVTTCIFTPSPIISCATARLLLPAGTFTLEDHQRLTAELTSLLRLRMESGKGNAALRAG